MTSSPKTKKQKIIKQLILSAATQGSAANWKNPKDQSREFTSSIKPWIKLAQLANKAKFHSLFFVDHLSWFDVYGETHTKAVEHGFNASRIDPAAVITALAQVTEDLGFSVTFSTVSEHPYHLSRRLASLDQLTNGRIGWNVVASYLPSIGENLLNGAPLPLHSERYEKTEEYLDIVYDLLLSSWRDDAVVYDKENGVFASPDSVRRINHSGKNFTVSGPAITEPSIQRFPVILQAGSSSRGKLFAAENAELVYIGIEDYEKAAADISGIRKIASEVFKRDPSSIKFIARANVFVAETHEAAELKQEEYKKYINDEEHFILFGGTSGIDLSKFDWDEPIVASDTNGIKGSLAPISNKEGKENNSKRQFLERRRQQGSRFVGTPQEIADIIEEAIRVTDIDGLNFATNVFPSGLEDIVELLVPELQKRGIAQKEYAVPGGTFRENLYGVKGKSFLTEDHPAYDLKWTKQETQKDFEKRLDKYKILRDQRRQEGLSTLPSVGFY